VLTQSYFLPAPLVALAVTSTAKAITSKQVLMGTSADQVGAAGSLLDGRPRAAAGQRGRAGAL
jgi:hypothetical protein